MFLRGNQSFGCVVSHVDSINPVSAINAIMKGVKYYEGLGGKMELSFIIAIFAFIAYNIWIRHGCNEDEGLTGLISYLRGSVPPEGNQSK